MEPWIKSKRKSILEAYYHLIENSKHYIYIENQFFISKSYSEEEKKNCPHSKNVKDVQNEIAFYLRKRIEKAYKNEENFKVYIILSSLPDYPGEIENSFTIQNILQYTYATISRNYGLSLIEQLEKVMGDNWKKYIGFYSLRNHGIMNNIPKTEIIYVHSKLMIVDDTKVLIGSANINDRSMIGVRDSEIGVLIEEEKQDYQIMDGEKDYKAAKLALMLRKKLMAEHLGIDSNDPILDDPLSLELSTLINSRAKNNTAIYHELFGCYPDDEYTTYNSIKNSKKLREKESSDVLLNKYKKMKDQIVGHVVEYPLQFLKDENLGKKKFGFENILPSYTFS
jgi:phospholipase D1/2